MEQSVLIKMLYREMRLCNMFDGSRAYDNSKLLCYTKYYAHVVAITLSFQPH